MKKNKYVVMKFSDKNVRYEWFETDVSKYS